MPYTEFINESSQVIKVRLVKTTTSGNVHIYLAGADEQDERYTALEHGVPDIIEWEYSET